VPLSPIRHSDSPLLTQPQPARVLMVAGLIALFAMKSKSARCLGRGMRARRRRPHTAVSRSKRAAAGR
jgi:hypothetical protein